MTFFSSVSAVGLWIFTNQYTHINQQLVLVGIGLIIFLVSLVFGKMISEFAIKPTDSIARAILIASGNELNVVAPTNKSLPAPSREFISDLLKKIYSSSTIDKTDQTNGELSRYRTISNTLPIPIIALDNNQNITFANEAALNYAELPANEVIDKKFYDTFNISFSTEKTLENWLQDIQYKSVTASNTWQRVQLTLSDNKHRLFDLIAHYSQDDPNGVETIVAMYDRTSLYEHSDHDLTFVALAVHELRTPVTVLRGYIELFEDELADKLDSEQKAFMHNMSANAQQLTLFVSNILNVTRIEENSFMVQLKEEDWANVLKQTCKDMDLRANVKGKKIVVHIADNMPKVAVDRVSIYEVISNLVENAIKYTHTDENIVIDSYLKDGQVVTTVTDKGVGIPENTMIHIFDKFYRSHSSKNSVGGTGLGLYLSKAIVTAHGGDIWVKSKEGKGSTFGFSLQLYDNIKDDINMQADGGIVRGAHGWIKNHTLYRG